MGMSETLSDTETKELIAEKIRCAGIDYKRKYDKTWRDKPFMDGIIMGLDESDEVDFLAEAVFRMLRRDGHAIEATK